MGIYQSPLAIANVSIVSLSLALDYEGVIFTNFTIFLVLATF